MDEKFGLHQHKITKELIAVSQLVSICSAGPTVPGYLVHISDSDRLFVMTVDYFNQHYEPFNLSVTNVPLGEEK